MPNTVTGDTFTTTVDTGLDTVVASARTTREFAPDVMLKTCDRQTLASGTGTAWREWLAAALTAENVGETETYDNPQEIDGSVLSFTPSLVVIQTFIGRRVQERLNPKAYATFGQLAQQAISRKKDQDGLALAAGATTTLCGSGQTLTSGHITAAVRRITSNATEPGPLPIAAVLHGFGVHYIQNELLAGVGTYPLPDGYTADIFKRGFRGTIMDCDVFEDGLIAINSTPDARGLVFAKMAVVLVQGMSPWTDKRYEPQKGYGGWNIYLKDEYVWGERSPGNWLYGVLHNGTSPSS